MSANGSTEGGAGNPADACAEGIALEALTFGDAERWAFVQERCAGNAELEQAVRSLILEATEADRYFRNLAALGGALLETTSDSSLEGGAEHDPAVPEWIGPYRVLHQLGSGGMGAVYLGERVEPDFRLQVAVKLLHPHLTSGLFLERFVSERRILASLSHPGIATLVDGGVTDDGFPYLAMQYVEGEDIVAWSDRRRLGLDARIRLFVQVCRSVAYAHQKLVVHRDLKPSNVQVTADGTVKLLDFGIARVLDTDDAGDLTRLNPASGIPLTPAYASPEQLRGERVGTASDIYSLGLLLWKLVGGETPLEHACGDAPAAPEDLDLSDVRPAGHFAESSRRTEIAALRGTSVAGLKRALGGDLTAILHKALRPTPEDRYGSAGDLAEDLDRLLKRRPVRARAGSTRYRVRKFASRHRWSLALVLIMVLAVAAGAAGLIVHSARLEVERDRAALEAERATAVTEFLVDLFNVAGEGGARDTIRAGVLLQEGEQRLRERLEAHPLIRADLLRSLARANASLGLDGDHIRLLEEVVGVFEAHFGPTDIELARALADVAAAQGHSRHWNDAEEAFQASLEIQRHHAQHAGQTRSDSILMGRTLGGLATPLRHLGHVDSAVVVARKSLHWEAAVALPASDFLFGISSLAYALRGAGRIDEAESLYRELLGSLDRPDPDGDRTGTPEGFRAMVLNNLASLVRSDGRTEEAERYFREALEIERRIRGPESPQVERVMTNLRVLMLEEERWPEAYDIAASWRSVMLRTQPPDHWRVGRAYINVGQVWAESGDCARALPDLEKGAEIYGAALGQTHEWTGGARVRVAECLFAMGQHEQAEPALIEALPHLTAAREPNLDLIALAVDLLSEIYLSTNREAAAERLRTAGPAAELLVGYAQP